MSARTNKEGLTFTEWYQAAGFEEWEMTDLARTEGAYAAWTAGEDPTEWRAGKVSP